MIRIKTENGVEIESLDNISILESALSSGIVFEYSCKTGRCGACAVTLIEGEVTVLTPQLALTNIDGENRTILTCCCAAKTSVLIDAEDLSALHGIKSKITPARINSLNLLSPDILEVKLRVPASTSIRFVEGQYIDVIGKKGRRSYSIASSSNDDEISLLIKKVEKGVLSDYWFNDAKIEDLLRLEGPKGTFFLRDASKALVFLATGTGIAPIISMLNGLDSDQSFKQRKHIKLYWGNRTSKDFVWEPKFVNLKVDFNPVVSRSDEKWQGKTGYIQDVALSELDNMDEVNVYACGSNEMINMAKKYFVNAGLNGKSFHSEIFVQSFDN